MRVPLENKGSLMGQSPLTISCIAYPYSYSYLFIEEPKGISKGLALCGQFRALRLWPAGSLALEKNGDL